MSKEIINKSNNSESFYMPNPPSEEEKYSYIIKYPIFLKILYAISAISWFGVLFGYIQFFNHELFYWAFVGPIVIYITVFQLISTYINFFYEKFLVNKHNSLRIKYWEGINKKPTIDVFLPVCGEDIRILSNTWKGVASMVHESYILNPIVLDDIGDFKIENLANEFNFQYLSRPNKGEIKKAGNLKYGFERSQGEYFIIFDADFVPRYDFILDLLPYMSQENIGIVQSPQFFDYDNNINNRSWLQFGAGNIQEYFYKIIQSARGKFDGTICVGSCALYKRSALNECGGTAQVEHSEDVRTGFNLLMKGWKIKYIPLVMSKGLCPDNLTAFFKQQTRWCTGSMSLMTSKEFWNAKVPVITKLCFISGFLYYISNPLMIILTFQTFFLIAYHSETIGIWNLLVFVPTIIVAILIQYIYVYPRLRIGTILAHGAATWFYSYTVITLLFGHEEKWDPTGLKHKVSKGFLSTVLFVSLYLCLYILGLVTLIYFQKIDFSNAYLYPLIFWIGINILYHLLFWISGINYLHKENMTEKVSSISWILNFQRIGLPIFLAICFSTIAFSSYNLNHEKAILGVQEFRSSTVSSITSSNSMSSQSKLINLN